MNYKELTGRENNNLILWDDKHSIYIHKDLEAPLRQMASDAKKNGIDLALISGYRNYERQLAIWNAKAHGQRPLLDRSEKPLLFKDASGEEILEAILCWSAVPGASRHHWGSEIDIFDASVKPKEKVSLTRSECREDFENLYTWLDENLNNYPFHRPYKDDLGGVAVEPWHLSLTPLSEKFEKNYTFEVFLKNLNESDMALKDLLIKDAENIFERYILNVAPA